MSASKKDRMQEIITVLWLSVQMQHIARLAAPWSREERYNPVIQRFCQAEEIALTRTQGPPLKQGVMPRRRHDGLFADDLTALPGDYGRIALKVKSRFHHSGVCVIPLGNDVAGEGIVDAFRIRNRPANEPAR